MPDALGPPCLTANVDMALNPTMRRELSKECRAQFRKMMKSQFPEYREAKGQGVPKGSYPWIRQDPSGIWFQIWLVIDSTRDAFTIEAIWSFDNIRPTRMYPDENKILDEPCLFRMNRLWSGQDYWWLLVLRPEEYERSISFYKDDPVEQCLQLVAPAIWDAAEKLKDHLMPVFDKILRPQNK